MRRLSGLLLVMVLALTVPALAADWQVVSPSGARFSVEMPTAPRHEVKTSGTVVGDIQRYKYVADQAPAEFGVQYMDLPGIVTMFKSPKSILKRAETDYLKGVNGKVVSEAEVTVSGYPARRVDFKLPDGSAGQALEVAVGKRLYFVHQVKASAADATRFLDSFRIVPKG